MPARVLSVNVGAAEPSPDPRSRVTTSGIRKRPVASAEVRAPGAKHGGRGSGVVGDHIGETRHHGGDTQAVYAVAREELDGWAERLGRELPDGWFGENLTITGLEVDEALVGERWRIGPEVVLEVSAPRIPCATFAARMGERGWVRRFTQHGRTGAYLSVAVPGTVRPGDPVEVLHRPAHGIDLVTVFRAFTGDRDTAAWVLASGALPAVEHAELDRKLRRTG